MTTNLSAFLDAVSAALGAEWVDQRPATVKRYGEHTLPGAERPPAAVLFPESTQQVQSIVRAANQYGVQLYPISTGNNIGLGSRAPVKPGQVIVDLGYRMNRILEVNEETCFAEVQ